MSNKMIICKIKTIKDFPLNKQTIIHSIKSVLIIKSFESAVKAVLCDHQVKQTTVLVSKTSTVVPTYCDHFMTEVN